MRTDRGAPIDEASDRLGRIASHFVAELFRALVRNGISTTALLGDLPIAVDERGELVGPVHLDPFRTLMRRLERDLGGRDGLERCGEWIASGSTSPIRQAAMAFVASPTWLYRIVLLWAVPRSFPGAALDLKSLAPNRLSLDIELPNRADPCSPMLHVTTGILRALPRLLDLPHAVVESRIEGHRGHWDVTVPSSRTVLARLRRRLRAIRAPESLLAPLESRQLELHAAHVALTRTHAALALREREIRARTDAVVDMVCEFDATGRIVFVNEAAHDVVGYSPEQMVGSHYRLWVPSMFHDFATKHFEAFARAPIGTTITRARAPLHAAHGRRIVAEVSFRSFESASGEWRAVATLRPVESTERMPGTARRISLDALADGRSPQSDHPLARSLARLVAALEARMVAGEDLGSAGALEATERMTRIVENVLVGETQEPAEWVEVEKLVGHLRDALAVRRDASALELRLDLARGPAELFGRAALFEVFFTSLVDWAVERCRAEAGHPGERHGASLEISLEGAPADGGGIPEARIEIRFRTGSPHGDRPTPAEASHGVDAELALAIALDALRALGGEPVALRAQDERSVRAFRIPQPERAAADPQSGRRSMSAPSARSFSSTRS